MVVPTLTAARRMRLRRRAWVSAWAAGMPLVSLLAVCGYQALAGPFEMETDPVTTTLGYLFAVVATLSAVVGVRTLLLLQTQHRLDAGLQSYLWAKRLSMAAIGSAAVCGILSLTLMPHFFRMP